MKKETHMNVELVDNRYDGPPQIWSYKVMDGLRREDCLCVNCDRKNDDPHPYGSCPVAGRLFAICVESNMALAVTRCGATDEDGLMYRPIVE